MTRHQLIAEIRKGLLIQLRSGSAEAGALLLRMVDTYPKDGLDCDVVAPPPPDASKADA